MKLLSVRYIGSDPRLAGKSALMDAKSSLVQFDDMELPEAYGWHEFKLSDFEVEPEE